ncbi:MAG TPA: ABC transporter, partial [Polyangiaceae bacterium]|nr:ABC transporter [Polyangiaceae bacterium]
LCPRVIVIDKGHISFDGTLEDLVHRIRPDKRVVLRLASPAAREALASLGTVVRHDAGEAILQVDQGDVSRTVARALSLLSVKDLTVEDAPLEEVMRELFAQNRAAAGARVLAPGTGTNGQEPSA